MSWIEKELKRRAKASARTQTPDPAPKAEPESEQTRISSLWHRLESANEALPPEIRLAIEGDSAPSPGNGPRIITWMRAPNGAGLGLAADAIRYAWPEQSSGRSHNFWIRWNAERGRFVVIQRVGQPFVAPPAVYRFNERRVDYMLQCLVTGRRVRARAVRKRWLGIV